MNFIIDEEHLCSVLEERVTSLTFLDVNLTFDDVKTTAFVDHPEFSKLRDRLESEGYIKVCNSTWNGDRVLRPFSLNGKMEFQIGETFQCSSALGIRMKLL